MIRLVLLRKTREAKNRKSWVFEMYLVLGKSRTGWKPIPQNKTIVLYQDF